MPTQRRLDILTRFADQGVVSLGNFLTALLLARILGPTHFGLFALLWTVVGLALGGHWALIAAPLQTTLSDVRIEQRGTLLSALLAHTLMLGGAAGAAALAVVLAWSDSPTDPLSLLAIPAAVLGILLQETTRRWLLGTERASLALASDAIRHAGLLGVLWLTASTGAGLAHGLLVMAGSAFVSLWPLHSDLRDACWSRVAVKAYAHEHLRSGRWLAPSVILQAVNASAPLYALGSGVSVAAAGGYRATLNLLSPVVSLTEALETFLPLRARQAFHRGGAHAVRRLLARWAVPCVAAVAVFVGLVCLAGRDLLNAVYGRDYAGFRDVLLPLALAMVLQFMTYILNVDLRTAARSRATFHADLLAAVALVTALSLSTSASAALVAAWAALSQAVKLAALVFASAIGPKKD